MMRAEEKQKQNKPMFKFDPNFKKTVELSNGTMESPLEQMVALKKNLEDRTRTESVNELSTLIETEGEEEINKAATFIQNKFRTYMSKKKSLDSINIDSPLDNGTNGHQMIDSGVSSL